ncbi:protein-disulfide reductase DsbD [Acinetobacter haemolyticus]|uniref:Protein-disulfide reductase DsbD n=1 Tax=Acinetobacter haemolyticus TaxID=29430 RepID=A0AAJ3D9B5_ACIHA|nr:protein-disulfide reductase DsbD [Acinetobacter haemolyticus]APR69039.1 thiol:disulfide interchange protein [Acinetobacter haemolyticus]NAR28986.1 protein-disulfide reductase DsbD [Acinetobacter haemolyticus]NAR73946.1 protein-disulfide reductase DsbD [Acinetobacter haemolyticus]NAR77154.1 protein-disulfide reductase DsbD [Acinetobacter haemolyticus]NCU24290.1 protein-disulfide reductase DsbD [Acinetobacter haemolyticus]
MKIYAQGGYSSELVRYFLGSLLLLCGSFTHAQENLSAQLLNPEDAFVFSVESSRADQARLHWEIQPDYYLYQHKFEVKQGNQPVALNLPQAKDQYDENYGHSQVYYDELAFEIPTQASQHYQVTWQGCAKDRICYPPQTIAFDTDANGLVNTQNLSPNAQKRFLDVARSANAINTQRPDLADISDQEQASAISSSNAAGQMAQDQKWSSRLAQHSLLYSIVLFLGLGILLAFTPCSLPMLPILTSLIVRENKGVKAWAIALTFVVSMAMIYALLGLIASAAGLNFQRWLQQPATLIAFSLLFVVFALNLFGLFELKMPQKWVNRLDHLQASQKGGTLVGASVMGMISALLVGPCMTAPLAGVLLFISQTQNQWQGALLLFTLGFGMGIPLLLATVLGARVLPKAGEWMHQIKVIFAFLMLALSLYFIRPLLPELALQTLSLILGLAFIIYAASRLLAQNSKLKWLYIVLLMITTPWFVFNQYQHIQNLNSVQADKLAEWHVAKTADEFQHILANAPKDRGIVIDVYADWCVACQPIEHRILKDAEVQQALAPYYLIKLDLSQYDASHQALLKQWDILGPPTYLFLNAQQQELRSLRLTGAFKKTELLQQLALFEGKS